MVADVIPTRAHHSGSPNSPQESAVTRGIVMTVMVILLRTNVQYQRSAGVGYD